MIKLIVNKKYVDLKEDYSFEMKKQHPISNGLSNVYTSYTTDITVDLTPQNVEIFDYSLLKKTTQVHKTLTGYLYTHQSFMLVDIIIKRFSTTGITFYLAERISEPIKKLLDGELMLDELKELYTEKQITHKVLGNLTSLPANYFAYNSYETTENQIPSISALELITSIEDEYDLTINAPIDFDFKVFANKLKLGNIKNVTGFTDNASSYLADIHALPMKGKGFCPTNLKDDKSYEAGTVPNAIHITTSEEWWFDFSGVIDAPLGSTVDFYIGGTILIHTFTGTGSPEQVLFSYNTNLNIGDYLFQVDISNTATFSNCFIAYQRMTERGKEIEIDTLHNYFVDCYENLPKVTVLAFLKAIALTNGYTLVFDGNTISFDDLENYFSTDNATDVSDYFIEATTEEFVYLKYKNNHIRYGDAEPYATIVVEDDTLEDEGDFLVIKEILPTDDTNVQLWAYEQGDTEVTATPRVGIATIPFQGVKLETYNAIANTLKDAYIYTAKFRPFKMGGEPIYVKQLNGFFLPTEITERSSGSQLKELTLKMIRL